MATDHDAVGEEPPVDALLGQPLMVADPRISVAQAARILDKTPAQVYRLVRLGRLVRRGAPNKAWELLLSDVRAHRGRGDPIKLNEAARILKPSVANVRELISAGQLALVPGSQRLLYPGDVRKIARTWVRPSRSHPRQASGPPGHIDTKAAARILGRSPSRTRQLAAVELIPATRDAQGRYWYRPDQLQVVLQAWQAAEQYGRRLDDEDRGTGGRTWRRRLGSHVSDALSEPSVAYSNKSVDGSVNEQESEHAIDDSHDSRWVRL